MSRANPFGDLDDFAPEPSAKPVPKETIEKIAQDSGFPSRKAQISAKDNEPSAPSTLAEAVKRPPRRHTTGRNRQINIKATEETIEQLYRVADELGLPLGAVLERALIALEQDKR